MIYEYNCRVCNYEFEVEQSIKADPLDECPKCLVSALKRVISGGSGFLLKGNTWAKDGYGLKGDKNDR